MKLSQSYASGLRHSNASQPTFHSGNSNSQLNYRQVKLVKIADHQEKRLNRKSAYATGMPGKKH